MTRKAPLVLGALGAIGIGLWAGVVRGSVTVDLRIGRCVPSVP